MRNAVILSLTLILLTVSPVLSITAYESPTDDARCFGRYPDRNYGSLGYIPTSYIVDYDVSLIEFDLSDYDGVTINAATLALYLYNVYSIQRESIIYRLNGYWDEDTVTYDTIPTENHDLSVTFTPPSSNGWVYLDLTAIVQSWVDSSFDNHGFIMGQTTDDYGFADFYSKEHTDPDLHPLLQINYTETGIESASLGEIKAAFK